MTMTDQATALTDQKTAKNPATSPEFSYRNVTRCFRSAGDKEFVALESVNFDIESGSFTCFIGPSGCGKTTLLNMSAGLLPPSDGAVYFRGKKLTSVNTGVGFITQHDNLLPWRTVERNVGIALEIQKVPRKERHRRVTEAIDLVGLSGFAERYPSQLSGGMQKRASLARGLVYGPPALLMDEPFGALDAQTRRVLQEELLTIWQASQKLVVFITHDIDEAVLLADRVIVLSGRPGMVRDEITVPLPRPRNLSRDLSRIHEVTWHIWSLLEADVRRELTIPR